MIIYPRLSLFRTFLAGTVVLTANGLLSQEEATEEEAVFELSPFVVDTSRDQGYSASETLAGSRVRTDLRDLATATSVVTEEFMEDVGATSSKDLLVYTTNTEVGGGSGNFSGVGNTEGSVELLAPPHNNTRVRGLDRADNTRGFFLTDIPWDGYNTDRVEIQRGPNSILFGVGSPAGIINTNLRPASFRDRGRLQNRIDEEGSLRWVFDYNKELVDDVLAVRFAALDDHQKYQQEPAYDRDKRIYGAVSFNPDLFGKRNPTTIRVNVEWGDIQANRPRWTPPLDRITPFFGGPTALEGLNRQVFDTAWASYNEVWINNVSGRVAVNPDYNEPWLGRVDNSTGNGAPVFIYDGSGEPLIIQSNPETGLGFDSNGEQDIDPTTGISGGNIQSIPGESWWLTVAPFSLYAKNANLIDGTLYQGAEKGFYKDLALRDPGIFDFYNQLIDGPNKREWQEWDAQNISISQGFLKGRLGVEFVFDRQRYEQGAIRPVRPEIYIDLTTHLNLTPTSYDTGGEVAPDFTDPATVSGGYPNPNVGRAFIQANPQNRGQSDWTERTHYRATAFLELRGSDVFDDKSFLARFFGRQIFTGLWQRSEKDTHRKRWSPWAVSTDYSARIAGDPGVRDVTRQVPVITYISGDLRGVDSASGLNLPNLNSSIFPSGTYSMLFFDPTWNAPDVPFNDPYSLPRSNGNSSQSENWQNYVGVSNLDIDVLSANDGDIDQLYLDVGKTREILDSHALTWQGYFFNGALVATVGWRRDEIATWGTSGEQDPLTDVPVADFPNPRPEDAFVAKGESVTWGVVAHLTDFFNIRLPRDTSISAFYNSGENFQPSNRVGFDAQKLPNARGETREYGIVLSTFEDRVTLRMTRYETEVTDASLAGTPLGQNSYWLYNANTWGAGKAAKILAYWDDHPLMASRLNEANEGFNKLTQEEKNFYRSTYSPTSSQEFRDATYDLPLNVAEREAAQAFIDSILPQEWYDAFSVDYNVAAAQAGDWDNLSTGWALNSPLGRLQSSSGNRVNGQTPEGTINQTSEGYEFELAAQITPNWNLAINAAKTESTRTDLGAAFKEFLDWNIERFEGPAGQMRVWGHNANTFQQFFEANIVGPYQFQLAANGQSAPEIRPWRVNLVTNYRFRDGKLKGFSIGGSYRWEDDVILGYEMNDDFSNLDVNRPIKGGSRNTVSLWASYNHRIAKGVNWNIRLEVRNAFGEDELIPISVNPDGTYANMRISTGRSFLVTNTITF
jgi:outer membrane receptor protein involved in Fe transport